MRRRALAVVLAAAVSAACAGKPFDVKRIRPVAPEALAGVAALGPLAVRASAIWDEEWALENLDANAVLAGVLPVRVDVENTGGSPAPLGRLQLELSGAGGERFKRLDAGKARKKIEGYYGLAVRSTAGDKIYREDFAANALDLGTPLAPGERRQGLVFFGLPEGLDEPVAATLTVREGKGGASLTLPPSRRAPAE